MQKVKVMSLVLVSGVILGGCLQAKQGTTPPSTTEPAAETTTLTGTISQSGSTFVLSGAGQAPVQLESYSVELSDYVGQSVSVTGMYSGDTLFVDEVE